MVAIDRAAAPWHLWAVAIAGLLWNGFQCTDYVLSQLRDPAWLAHVPAEMPAYLDSFPWWSTALWAVGVWGSLAGSVLLLARSRHAALAFLLAWLSTAITYGYHYVIGMPASIDTPAINLGKTVIFAAIVAQWCYACRMREQRVLG